MLFNLAVMWALGFMAGGVGTWMVMNYRLRNLRRRIWIIGEAQGAMTKDLWPDLSREDRD